MKNLNKKNVTMGPGIIREKIQRGELPATWTEAADAEEKLTELFLRDNSNKCPHCGGEINPAALLGKIKSEAKTAAARENAKKPRPGAKGKPKPRKPKAE